MEVDSLGRNKYFVTFIDDTSRKTWVYLLHTKMLGISVFLEIPCLGGERDEKSFKVTSN